MKKTITVFLTLILVLTTTAAIATNADYSTLSTDELLEMRNAIDAEIVSRGALNNPNDVSQLKPGDEVTIIGEVYYTVGDDNMITVRAQQPDRIYVLYRSQITDNFLDEAKKLNDGAIVKLKGYFLSIDDFEEESTLRWVTLYDCEIAE